MRSRGLPGYRKCLRSVLFLILVSIMFLSTPVSVASAADNPRPVNPTVDTLIQVLFKYLASGEIAKQDLVPLTQKLHHILYRAEEGQTATAANLMRAFINQVEAQAGKKISEAAAAELIETARAVMVGW